MPNWCENHLQVTGPEDVLAEFLHAARGEEELDFTKLRPQPNIGAFGDAWYGWRVTHWGTKWEPVDIEVPERIPGCAAFEFFTAWSPPEALLDWCSSRWPQLRFALSYAESGNCFAGRTVFEAGRIVEERSGIYADICGPVSDEDDDWARRGPLEDVCAELALDEQLLLLDQAADRLTSGRAGGAGDARSRPRAELDELLFAAARRGHHQLVSALVPALDLPQVIALAQLAANSLSSSSGTLRALCDSDDEVVASIGRIFDLLGPALTVDVPGRVLRDGSEPTVPAFGEILEQALAAQRCKEWVETVAGLLPEWASDDVETLLRAAWDLG